MKSPFPGMDPYIEACGLWEDFHNHLVEQIGSVLADALPSGYTVRTGERAYVVLARRDGKDDHAFKADVEILAKPSAKKPRKKKGTVVAEAAETEAVPMRAFIATEYRETFIEIYEHREEKRLVTCVEVLSPSNKAKGTKGRRLYLRKRQALLLGAANLVEIDLVRAGTPMPMLDPWPESPYTLLVAREDRAPHCRAWPAHFHRPLPAIPVPLSSPDPDLTLELQPLIEGIYVRWRYSDDIDYTRPLKPPLADTESARVSELLRARSKKP